MVSISPIEEIIADIHSGRIVILVDGEDRENEGDLVLAADFVTPEAINFMAKRGRGLICLSMTADRCKQLNLPLMVSNNRSSHGTNFTVSIEAAEGVSTGISAADRALTVKKAVAAHAKPSDLVQPGHVFPLMAQTGGVLVRAGHTEAGCDLATLAGLTPAAVICEIMNDDGTMARLPQLCDFAAQQGLKIGTIADLIHYRNSTETLIECVGTRAIKTFAGDFLLYVFRDLVTQDTHLALVKGHIVSEQETLVRVHEPLSVMDWLDLERSSHSWSVAHALQAIQATKQGILLFLHRTETGADVYARALPQLGREPSRKWDLRTHGIGAQMLRALGVGKMRLMSIECKMPSMVGFGLEVTGFLEPPREEKKK